MNTAKKTLKTGLGVALLLTSMAADTREQIADGGRVFGVGGIRWY